MGSLPSRQVIDLPEITDQDQDQTEEDIESKKKSDNEQEEHIPPLTYLQLFKIFLLFGLKAWGGPVAQIDMIKQQLVIEQKWVSVAKFQRILAVYQVLPGPEASELCCYFGMIAKGRIGSIIAGFGFMLPGFCLMLFFSWLYDEYGIENEYVKASFRSVQPAVTAMIFRAVHRLSEHAFEEAETHQFSYWLFLIGCASAIQSVLRINFFITLAYSGILYFLVSRKTVSKKHWYYAAAALLTFAGIIGYVLYVYYMGFPGSVSFGAGGVGGKKSLSGLFLLGLLAGLLTFGGAYTAIPFLRQDAVVLGGWMTNQQFLDGLAIGAILPSPLVIISTFVGYIGGGFPGAILMTIGMFLPAFSFTFLGHGLFEKLVTMKGVTTVLDGVTAGVIGLVFITAFQLLKSAVEDPIASVLFILALMSLQTFKNKFTSVILVFAAATVGQVLYVDE